jgi:hypothetical protein
MILYKLRLNILTTSLDYYLNSSINFIIENQASLTYFLGGIQYILVCVIRIMKYI